MRDNGAGRAAAPNHGAAPVEIMDKKTLTFLLSGGHLSMAERMERGIWPHEPLKYSDVVRQLASIIRSQKWFPCEWQPAVPGESIREGGVIERKTGFLFIYRCQRHQATHPTILAEQSKKIFFSAKSMARFYMKWDLALPGDLDGWKVIR